MTDDEDEREYHPKRLTNRNATRPQAPKKEYDRLVRAAWQAGWWCERRKNYIDRYPPNDEGVVLVKSSPKKQGTLNLTIATFKKLGLEL